MSREKKKTARKQRKEREKVNSPGTSHPRQRLGSENDNEKKAGIPPGVLVHLPGFREDA